MGLLLSRSSAVQRMSSFVSFFVRSESPFLRPDPQQGQGRRAQGAVKVGRRTYLSICFALAARPYLDSFEHDGTLMRSRRRSEGSRFRARFSRAATLYSVGPRTRTMMQSCASAAKLRNGGPILPFGLKAKGRLGIPPPRTDRKSTRLNSSHRSLSRMPSSA